MHWEMWFSFGLLSKQIKLYVALPLHHILPLLGGQRVKKMHQSRKHVIFNPNSKFSGIFNSSVKFFWSLGLNRVNSHIYELTVTYLIWNITRTRKNFNRLEILWTGIGWFKNTRANNSYGLCLLVKTILVRLRLQTASYYYSLLLTPHKSLNSQ